MRDLLFLYSLAEKDNIDVDCFELDEVESLSIPLAPGKYGIAINPMKLCSVADERVKLAHELGHCETGAFYNRYSCFDVRQKHENRADRWAIRQLISKDALSLAVRSGITELWELADYFQVTEPFMRKAVEYYKMLETA